MTSFEWPQNGVFYAKAENIQSLRKYWKQSFYFNTKP